MSESLFDISLSLKTILKVNKLHFMNGPSEQRLGNRAFMPPEILSSRVGSTLDYRFLSVLKIQFKIFKDKPIDGQCL